MQSVTLGIRPEDVTLETGTTEDAGAIEATVDVVEPMGDLSYVYLTVGGTETGEAVRSRAVPEDRSVQGGGIAG